MVELFIIVSDSKPPLFSIFLFYIRDHPYRRWSCFVLSLFSFHCSSTFRIVVLDLASYSCICRVNLPLPHFLFFVCILILSYSLCCLFAFVFLLLVLPTLAAHDLPIPTSALRERTQGPSYKFLDDGRQYKQSQDLGRPKTDMG